MTYYLSLGANLGEREQTLRRAIRMIEQQVGSVRRCSSFFYSAPWGFTSENDFCNLCCAVETNKSPLDVLSLTQTIERALGRTKKTLMTNDQCQIPHYSDRSIDIDIIRLFDGDKELFVDLPELHIPHPLWTQREFVKVPLAEIMPL